MNQNRILVVGKLMANHRAGIKPRIPVADHILHFLEDPILLQHQLASYPC
jgi:hypothetical protein